MGNNCSHHKNIARVNFTNASTKAIQYAPTEEPRPKHIPPPKKIKMPMYFSSSMPTQLWIDTDISNIDPDMYDYDFTQICSGISPNNDYAKALSSSSGYFCEQCSKSICDASFVDTQFRRILTPRHIPKHHASPNSKNYNSDFISVDKNSFIHSQQTPPTSFIDMSVLPLCGFDRK
jgi:hypothetical protein